jgi:hypothetical protein
MAMHNCNPSYLGSRRWGGLKFKTSPGEWGGKVSVNQQTRYGGMYLQSKQLRGIRVVLIGGSRSKTSPRQNQEPI